ncbi:Remorin family protein isoform 2 [Senna tora]|uniref:Remorin family protein isoform 2 n=1 Tax=Senna tora TaxID=362788 RepID=A0A834TXX1_9FABA|nr:Remorin family protein isoform 2 [Senna tora]
MPELGFQERSSSRTELRPRDSSPDSVIFTLESNFSLFSSASASVDRCSFASDAHDHDSLASEISLVLQSAGHDGDFSHNENWSGPDPDPNKHAVNKKHSRLSRKGEKGEDVSRFLFPRTFHAVQKEDSNADDIEDGNQVLELDSARNSFSLALKECQDRRLRSEALLKKPDRRRPASLDLNNATVSSPRLGTLKKSAVSTRKCNNFPSPGTPNYRQAGVAMQKGWSSERVPLHSSASRKHVSAALLPLNSGRTLPSKWEDAERWIFSPVSGDGTGRSSLPQPQRRPKSKSGPLGPPGIAYHSLYSPAVPMIEGGNAGNFMVGSPFTAGVIAADGLTICTSGHGGELPTRTDPCMARSASVHGFSEMQSQSSNPSQEEKFEGLKDAATNISRSVSRRDMATQMSPEDSICSSPSMRASFSVSTMSALPITDLQGASTPKMDIRDVQIDERVTMTRWSKKHRALFIGRGSEIVDNCKKKEISAQSSAWDVSETAKSVSKVKREEARISAWENLQKAKAEAAIRKLEMKLEKKRSSSMDKIMNKLKLAQKKAQEMRSSVSDNQAHQVGRNFHKALSFRRTSHMGSLSGCFTCHAF